MRIRSVTILLLAALVISGCSNYVEVTVPSDLPVGQPFKIDIPGEKASITFPTPNSTEEFYFILYTSERGDYEHEVKIQSNLISTSGEIPPLLHDIRPEFSNTTDFNSMLRETETEISKSISVRGTLPKITPKFTGTVLPQTMEFKVINSYRNPKSYSTVNARLITSSDNSAIYLDIDTYPEIKDNEAFLPALERLRQNFDDIIAPIDRYYFGDESNIDGIKQVIILMSPVVNNIDTGGMGKILGFFYAGDLTPDEGDFPSSNETEIMYIAIPDSGFTPGLTAQSEIIDYCVDSIFHGTLAHEFQHMINFNQHVLVSKGKSEEIWLNEGLSHLAEDLTGYGLGNIGRVTTFFNSTDTYPLATKNDSTGTRGASYLFLRYLHDRFDPDSSGYYLRQISSSKRRGTENISNALSIDFNTVFTDWLAALALSNSGMSEDPVYNYLPPYDPGTESKNGPFQIGIDIRGENFERYILHGPRFQELEDLRIIMNPASSSFYTIKAQNSLDLEVELTLQGNKGSGAIVIPSVK